jgi:putative transposase
MNHRDYKQFALEGIYHVYNRGTGKMKIFRDEEDYLFFIHRLNQNLGLTPIATKNRAYTLKPLPKGAFSVFSYCFMPNHFHILLQQNTDLSIAVLIGKVCTSYSKYFNKKYGRVGTLFQDQFKAVRVSSNRQLQTVAAYIYENPVRAKIVQNPADYPYSKMVPILQIC